MATFEIRGRYGMEFSGVQVEADTAEAARQILTEQFTVSDLLEYSDADEIDIDQAVLVALDDS